ncbi:MAG: BadF/BadG/BcrA/BcrD ATPase family protein [Acidobacteriota bacterium]
MSLYMGIDLGSTTTKAVLMDEQDRLLGWGITNTRSDYHIATSVAEKEARTRARFALLWRNLEEDGLEVDLLRGLEQFFTLETFRYRLHRLREFAFQQAEGGNRSLAGRLHQALEAIFQRLEETCAADAQISQRLRTSFFRDLVGVSFMTLAESEAGRFELDFEDVMGVYDAAILREENAVLDMDFAATLKRCPLLTGAQPPVAACLRRGVGAAARASLETDNMVGTGYGRQRLPFAEHQIRSEVLCHGLGAHYFFPATRTVLDIGGQDTKAIQLDEKGLATNFQMNDRCAAGCGRYLGYVADELNLTLDQLGPMALKARRAVSVSSTCTVFAGVELRERLELGEKREDILAGLHRAIVLRAMSLLARSGGIHEEFTFTGGVARNPAVVQALQTLTRKSYGTVTLNIHPDSIYTGAVGAALYARRDLPAAAAVSLEEVS